MINGVISCMIHTRLGYQVVYWLEEGVTDHHVVCNYKIIYNLVKELSPKHLKG